MDYIVWNAIDGIPACPRLYPNRLEAEGARISFLKRFLKYYTSARQHRIPVDRLMENITVYPYNDKRFLEDENPENE